MRFEEATLDLTGFHKGNFHGVIRLRQIADWAHDYYKEGYYLSRLKLNDDMWHELKHEIEQDDRFLRATPTEGFSIDLGFGEIEIINIDKKSVH